MPETSYKVITRDSGEREDVRDRLDRLEDSMRDLTKQIGRNGKYEHQGGGLDVQDLVLIGAVAAVPTILTNADLRKGVIRHAAPFVNSIAALLASEWVAHSIPDETAIDGISRDVAHLAGLAGALFKLPSDGRAARDAGGGASAV